MKYAKQFLAAAILLLALSCGKNNKTAIADDEIASAFVDVKTKGWLEIRRRRRRRRADTPQEMLHRLL